jgi:hypothetical protein
MNLTIELKHILNHIRSTKKGKGPHGYDYKGVLIKDCMASSKVAMSP